VSEPHSSPERPRAALPRRRAAADWLLALAVAWLLAAIPFLARDALERLPGAYAHAGAALTESRGLRIHQEIGVSPAVGKLLADRLGQSGRMVVYCPYPGEVFVGLLRLQYERLKNLLYPEPRDVRFARSADELGGWIEPRFENKLVVVDGTQESGPLPVAAEFELMAEQPIGGGGRLRYWLLRKAGQ